MKYIIDTDPGHDDAMAIMLAVKAGLDILAVTTVAGNSTVDNTTRNAKYVLKVLGREDIPLYSGSKKPLRRSLVQAVVHGKSGLEGIDPKINVSIKGNAVEKIISLIKQNKNVTLITLGPLTNIAKAILKDPIAMSKLKQIVIMGGALKVPGNKNRTAEFNMFVDPEAADIVFKFNIKKTIIPLDACNNIKFTLNDFKKINGALRKILLLMMRPYIKNIFKDEGVNAALMYDPLTVYYIIKPEACKTKRYDILIETKGELTRGMTVADFRKKHANLNIVNVVESISQRQFKNDFINILSK